MKYLFHKNFEKQLNRLQPYLREQFYERLTIFLKNPFHSQLQNHELAGGYKGSWSINISGDIRAIYDVVDDGVIQFTHIGTHHQLYGN